MKKLLIIISFVVPGLMLTSVTDCQVPREKRFTIGVELYTSGKYQEALNEWIDIYNAGYSSASLYYNIGNAYFKLNNIPGAVLFYEKARLLKPGDSNINYNLGIARSLVVDKFEAIPDLFFVRWYDFVALLNNSNTWSLISIIAFILSLILLSVYLYTSKYRLKIIGFWTAIILFVISLLALTLAARNKTLVFDNREAIIFTPVVNGKSSPDNSGNDLFVLHEGSKVSIEDEVGDWYEIKLSDGNKGWVPADCLRTI